jgi:tight adherence protein B
MSIAAGEFLAMMVLTFVAVVLLLESLYLVWKSRHGQEARKLRDRLRDAAGAPGAAAERHLLKDRPGRDDAPMERLAHALPGAAALRSLLLQSGLAWSPGRLLGLSAIFALAGFAVAATVYPVWLAEAGGAIVLAMVPVSYVHWRRGKRMRKIEQQLPEALDLIGRGLRAGHAFSSTLKMAGEELQEPIAADFRVVHDEINFGMSMQQALANLAERVPLTDVRYFVVSVLIQRESGGNLTEILGNLSRLIRERLKLMARVRVLSSEGRLSALILVAMPFALAAIMSIVNNEFMSRLWTDPLGITLIKLMLGMMIVGVVMLRKIVRIRF